MPTERFKTLVLGDNLTGTDNGDNTITIDATDTVGGGVTPADTYAWLPLTTVVGSVPELVWGADDSLIPTYTPI